MYRKWMTNPVMVLVACGLLGLGMGCTSASKTKCCAAIEKTCPMQTVVRHVVCFKYKSTATPEDIEKINQAFANLKNEMPFIIGIEMGPNISPEGLSRGFTHCYIVTFKDRQGRDEYLPHPAHKALVEKLGPILEETFVVDYESVPVCCCNCQCGK